MMGHNISVLFTNMRIHSTKTLHRSLYVYRRGQWSHN